MHTGKTDNESVKDETIESRKEYQANFATDPSLPQVLAIRLLMSGKEVGSIIGKKGENVKAYREKSGARINISDGSCPERVVTVTGTVEQIFGAFVMICQKFEDDCIESLLKCNKAEEITCPPVTLRVLVPAIQCGPIIGKGGSKIKEIRDLTGASIQVASELLPNSSERSVTVSGAAKAVAKCIQTISRILVNSPPKGTVILYRSKPSSPGIVSPTAFIFPSAATMPNHNGNAPPSAILVTPEFQQNLASRNASTVPGSFNSPQIPLAMQMSSPILSAPASNTPSTSPYIANHLLTLMANCSGMPFCTDSPINNYSFSSTNSLFQSNNDHSLDENHFADSMNLSMQHDCLSPPTNRLASWQKLGDNYVFELLIPNDLIGCIIGRGGSKINEIRQVSKAQIKISNVDSGGRTRKITISGGANQITTAKQLISSSIDLHKHLLALNSAMVMESYSHPLAGFMMGLSPSNSQYIQSTVETNTKHFKETSPTAQST